MKNVSLVKVALTLACLASTYVRANPVQFTFNGVVTGNVNGNATAGCLASPSPASCLSEAPPIGVQLSIVMLLDAHLPPQPEGNAPYPGTTTRYDIVGPSSIDFGYRPEFRFSNFYVRVVDDNIGNSAPDRLYVIRDEHIVSRQVPEAWFNIEFDSASTSFLSGSNLPTSLDLSLTQGGEPYFGAPHGVVFISFNGTNAYQSQFVITGVEVSQPVPEPSTYLMLLAGLGLLGFTRISRLRS
jgi:hypothetical protein